MNNQPLNDPARREPSLAEDRDPKGKTEGAMFGTGGGAILGGAIGSLGGPGGTVVGALAGAATGAALGLAVGAGGKPDAPKVPPDEAKRNPAGD